MRKTFLVLMALSACAAFSGAARADVCGGRSISLNGFADRTAAGLCRVEAPVGRSVAASDRARIELAQYYERDEGYGGGFGGMRYCRTWAQGMVAMGIEAARRGCLQYGPQGLHANFEAHIDWCLGVSRGRSQARAARANALLASCDR